MININTRNLTIRGCREVLSYHLCLFYYYKKFFWLVEFSTGVKRKVLILQDRATAIYCNTFKKGQVESSSHIIIAMGVILIM